MARIEQNRYGVFSVSFRWADRRFKKSLKTRNRRDAESQRARLEENLQLAERGLLTIPDDGDVARFLLTDVRAGSVTAANSVARPQPLTLAELFARYDKSLPEGAVEQNTLKTIHIHMDHLQRVIGQRFAVD